MKYATARLYADQEKAARRIVEIANAVEPIQGRIHIEKINEPLLSEIAPARPSTARASNSRSSAAGSRCTGTLVTFAPAGVELFALRGKETAPALAE